jgi:hypothetical protein
MRGDDQVQCGRDGNRLTDHPKPWQQQVEENFCHGKTV